MIKEFVELIYWKISLLWLNIQLRYLIIKNKHLRRRLDKIYRSMR